MTGNPLDWLKTRAAERAAAGLRRRLRPRSARDPLLDLASNDYLGLARDPRVVAGAVDAVRAWGAGSTGSRLVTGSTELHAELERELAEHVGAAAGLVFSSGYLANLGAIAALTGPGALVVSDALNHASIVDACRLSRARVVVTPHRDVTAVEKALADRTEERALVVVDAVFSVDGDLAPLAELAGVCRRQGAALLVDEAHGLGVIGTGGRGAAHAAGLAGAPDVVVTATLSKALGSQGGAVLASQDVVDHLVDAARTFIFDTGLAPACAGAALAALRVLRAEPHLAERVRDRARELAGLAHALGLPVTRPEGAVASVLIGEPAAAVRAAERCAELGVRVGCFRPPSVPDGVSRLRLTARADLTDEDLALARRALAAVRG
ncbi:8-amino-7-oxononanoate synthase [Carbonactinospora thermoautotrophica]|uniref:8-amino-7-oxononanoate synthase n=1 Tax=Carbonactinospora thermoautotrophica TaxID=1469144 RepID=UPI00226D529D|nr:8-amino-7-oxononanoate synthase [Carbonactinospora thermoautotrophica]